MSASVSPRICIRTFPSTQARVRSRRLRAETLIFMGTSVRDCSGSAYMRLRGALDRGNVTEAPPHRARFTISFLIRLAQWARNFWCFQPLAASSGLLLRPRGHETVSRPLRRPGGVLKGALLMRLPRPALPRSHGDGWAAELRRQLSWSMRIGAFGPLPSRSAAALCSEPSAELPRA